MGSGASAAAYLNLAFDDVISVSSLGSTTATETSECAANIPIDPGVYSISREMPVEQARLIQALDLRGSIAMCRWLQRQGINLY